MIGWIKKLFSKKKIIEPSPEWIELFQEYEMYRQKVYLLFLAITLKHKGSLFIEKEFIDIAGSGEYDVNMDEQNNGVSLNIYLAEKEDAS